MREILIATLLLGCLITFTSAQRGLFEFYDSYGRCWRCLPGSACVRCNTIYVPFVSGPPSEWDRTCSQPTEAICLANPGVKFPHTDIGFYWICADEGVIVEAPCFCDHVFDMRQQQCVKIEDLETIACNTYANTEPHDCASEDPRPPPATLAPGDTTTTITTTTTTTVPGNIPTIPTAPNETPSTTTTTRPTISVPTAPNDPNTPTTTTITTTNPPWWIPTAPNETPTTTESTTTTTTSYVNGGPTTTTSMTTTTMSRTTEMGGAGTHTFPGNSTTTLAGITTPAPCVCVVWWPCWCNPCWNMPCHSCNGCVGMMG